MAKQRQYDGPAVVKASCGHYTVVYPNPALRAEALAETAKYPCPRCIGERPDPEEGITDATLARWGAAWVEAAQSTAAEMSGPIN